LEEEVSGQRRHRLRFNRIEQDVTWMQGSQEPEWKPEPEPQRTQRNTEEYPSADFRAKPEAVSARSALEPLDFLLTFF
jgi:hypothetical protein